MKQPYNRKRIAALLTLALLVAGFGSMHRAYAATITVTTFADNLADNDDCSLREAIQAANTDSVVDSCPAGSGADTIMLVTGTYTLGIAGAGEDQNQTGDLDILDDVTITGADYFATIIDASNLDRVFHIHSGSDVKLNGMSVTHGSSGDGGGILSEQATLSLNSLIVRNNTSASNGGGIFNSGGVLQIYDSAIGDNHAGDGGGIENTAGTVQIINSTINNNTASGNGSGIHNAAQLLVDHTWIHDNSASVSGAGIFNAGTASVTNSFIHNDHASQNGGNIYSGDSGLSSLTISNTTIWRGSAGANGGGVFNDGALVLKNVTIAENGASSGGGVYNYNAGNTQPLELTNTTIVSNTNSAANPGEGIVNVGAGLTLKNTLVAYNGTLGNCAGLISSAGHNLTSDGTCSFTATGDLINTNPLLSPLQDNGGVTFAYGGAAPTYALLPGSPAINGGTNAGCPATDQRNVSRPRGPSCDIGAYETNDKPSALADAYITNEDIALDVSQPGVLGNDTDPDGDVITASLVSQPVHGVLTLNANGSFSYTPDANYHGPDSFSYLAGDGALSSPSTVVSLTVNSVNDPPIALADSYSGDHDTPLIISQPGVLGNDSDADADPLTATLVSGPAHGVLALNANGSFSYTPNANYYGSDSFSYRAGDGVLFSAPAIVALTIRGQNSLPVAGSDAASTWINTPVLIPIAKLLNNDSDPDGDPLTISNVRGNSALDGQVTLTGGNVVYTPPAHFTGVDSLSYTLSDGHGGIANGTVTVTVGMRQLYLPAARR